MRFCSPPITDLRLLKNAPNESELAVVKYLDQHLDEAWEIYFKPHLNGLRPDIVVLHPRVGIAVFKVKDWDLTKYQRDSAGKLYTHDQTGQKRYVKDPIDQVQLYKKELLTLYLASLKKGAQANSILTSALIFTGATQNQAMNLFAEHLRNEYYNGSDNETVFNFNPILGNDCFTSVDITKVFPGSVYQYSRFMNENIYKELKNWLVEPSMPRDQRTLLGIEVDAKQKALIGSM